MRYQLLVSAPLLVFASCGDAPVEGGAQGLPALSVAGNSGCYTVAFNSSGVGVFPSFPGAVLTGDLVGTLDVLFDPQALQFSGVTIRNEGLATWQITGGIVSELVGESFQTITSPINVNSPDQQPQLARINGKDRALSGVATVNLTYQGTFDTRDGAPPFEVALDWRGVICP